MASINKSIRRERKIQKRSNNQVVDSRSVFTIRDEQRKRSEEIKRRREEKASLQDLD